MYVKYVHKNVYAPVSPIEFKIGRLCGVFVQSATSAYVDIHVYLIRHGRHRSNNFEHLLDKVNGGRS